MYKYSYVCVCRVCLVCVSVFVQQCRVQVQSGFYSGCCGCGKDGSSTADGEKETAS